MEETEEHDDRNEESKMVARGSQSSVLLDRRDLPPQHVQIILQSFVNFLQNQDSVIFKKEVSNKDNKDIKEYRSVSVNSLPMPETQTSNTSMHAYINYRKNMHQRMIEISNNVSQMIIESCHGIDTICNKVRACLTEINISSADSISEVGQSDFEELKTKYLEKTSQDADTKCSTEVSIIESLSGLTGDQNPQKKESEEKVLAPFFTIITEGNKLTLQKTDSNRRMSRLKNKLSLAKLNRHLNKRPNILDAFKNALINNSEVDEYEVMDKVVENMNEEICNLSSTLTGVDENISENKKELRINKIEAKQKIVMKRPPDPTRRFAPIKIMQDQIGITAAPVTDETDVSESEGNPNEMKKSESLAKLLPDVYRRPGVTDLHIKLLVQIEANDSYICFQRLMNRDLRKNLRSRHSQLKQLVAEPPFDLTPEPQSTQSTMSNTSSVFTPSAKDIKKKYTDSLWFSERQLIRKKNEKKGKRISRTSQSSQASLKSNTGLHSRHRLRSEAYSVRGSVASLRSRSRNAVAKGASSLQTTAVNSHRRSPSTQSVKSSIGSVKERVPSVRVINKAPCDQHTKYRLQCMRARSLLSPSRNLDYLDILDDLTEKDLLPLKSEYPRRDNLTEDIEPRRHVEDTYLYKILHGKLNSNTTWSRLMEPSVECTDEECFTCKPERGTEHPGRNKVSDGVTVIQQEGKFYTNIKSGSNRTSDMQVFQNRKFSRHDVVRKLIPYMTDPDTPPLPPESVPTVQKGVRSNAHGRPIQSVSVWMVKVYYDKPVAVGPRRSKHMGDQTEVPVKLEASATITGKSVSAAISRGSPMAPKLPLVPMKEPKFQSQRATWAPPPSSCQTQAPGPPDRGVVTITHAQAPNTNVTAFKGTTEENVSPRKVGQQLVSFIQKQSDVYVFPQPKYAQPVLKSPTMSPSVLFLQEVKPTCILDPGGFNFPSPPHTPRVATSATPAIPSPPTRTSPPIKMSPQPVRAPLKPSGTLSKNANLPLARCKQMALKTNPATFKVAGAPSNKIPGSSALMSHRSMATPKNHASPHLKSASLLSNEGVLTCDRTNKTSNHQKQMMDQLKGLKQKNNAIQNNIQKAINVIESKVMHILQTPVDDNSVEAFEDMEKEITNVLNFMKNNANAKKRVCVNGKQTYIPDRIEEEYNTVSQELFKKLDRILESSLSRCSSSLTDGASKDKLSNKSPMSSTSVEELGSSGNPKTKATPLKRPGQTRKVSLTGANNKKMKMPFNPVPKRPVDLPPPMPFESSYNCSGDRQENHAVAQDTDAKPLTSLAENNGGDYVTTEYSIEKPTEEVAFDTGAADMMTIDDINEISDRMVVSSLTHDEDEPNMSSYVTVTDDTCAPVVPPETALISENTVEKEMPDNEVQLKSSVSLEFHANSEKDAQDIIHSCTGVGLHFASKMNHTIYIKEESNVTPVDPDVTQVMKTAEVDTVSACDQWLYNRLEYTDKSAIGDNNIMSHRQDSDASEPTESPREMSHGITDYGVLYRETDDTKQYDCSSPRVKFDDFDALPQKEEQPCDPKIDKLSSCNPLPACDSPTNDIPGHNEPNFMTTLHKENDIIPHDSDVPEKEILNKLLLERLESKSDVEEMDLSNFSLSDDVKLDDLRSVRSDEIDEDSFSENVNKIIQRVEDIYSQLDDIQVANNDPPCRENMNNLLLTNPNVPRFKEESFDSEVTSEKFLTPFMQAVKEQRNDPEGSKLQRSPSLYNVLSFLDTLSNIREEKAIEVYTARLVYNAYACRTSTLLNLSRLEYTAKLEMPQSCLKKPTQEKVKLSKQKKVSFLVRKEDKGSQVIVCPYHKIKQLKVSSDQFPPISKDEKAVAEVHDHHLHTAQQGQSQIHRQDSQEDMYEDTQDHEGESYEGKSQTEHIITDNKRKHLEENDHTMHQYKRHRGHMHRPQHQHNITEPQGNSTDQNHQQMQVQHERFSLCGQMDSLEGPDKYSLAEKHVQQEQFESSTESEDRETYLSEESNQLTHDVFSTETDTGEGPERCEELEIDTDEYKHNEFTEIYEHRVYKNKDNIPVFYDERITRGSNEISESKTTCESKSVELSNTDKSTQVYCHLEPKPKCIQDVVNQETSGNNEDITERTNEYTYKPHVQIFINNSEEGPKIKEHLGGTYGKDFREFETSGLLEPITDINEFNSLLTTNKLTLPSTPMVMPDIVNTVEAKHKNGENRTLLKSFYAFIYIIMFTALNMEYKCG